MHARPHRASESAHATRAGIEALRARLPCRGLVARTSAAEMDTSRARGRTCDRAGCVAPEGGDCAGRLLRVLGRPDSRRAEADSTLWRTVPRNNGVDLDTEPTLDLRGIRPDVHRDLRLRSHHDAARTGSPRRDHFGTP